MLVYIDVGQTTFLVLGSIVFMVITHMSVYHRGIKRGKDQMMDMISELL